MSKKLSTEQIIAGCRKGQPAFQRALVDNYSEMLYSICLRYTGNPTHAQDVLQDAFIRIFKYFNKYDPKKGAISTWMRRVTVNVALKTIQKKRLDLVSIENQTNEIHSTTPDAMDHLSHQDLMKLVMSLPEGYRQVFNLNVIDGYSHKEIADLVGIKEVTSRSNLSRAKQILRNKLNKLKIVDPWINSI